MSVRTVLFYAGTTLLGVRDIAPYEVTFTPTVLER